MPLTQFEITRLACVTVVMIGMTIVWIHQSSQQKVPRNLTTGIQIALRIVLLQMGFAYILCRVLSVPVDAYLIIAAVVFFVAAAVTLDSVPADSAIGFGIIMMFMIPLYILKQFVLGFPDRDLVILSPPSLPIEPSLAPRTTDLGVVVLTLRPMGTIELAGERFNAASETGELIDVGTPIRVTGQRSNTFLVRRIDPGTERASPHPV